MIDISDQNIYRKPKSFIEFFFFRIQHAVQYVQYPYVAIQVFPFLMFEIFLLNTNLQMLLFQCNYFRVASFKYEDMTIIFF
jgi:hypothetical protein